MTREQALHLADTKMAQEVDAKNFYFKKQITYPNLDFTLTVKKSGIRDNILVLRTVFIQ